MSVHRFLVITLLALAEAGAQVDDLFDRVDEALTFSTSGGQARMKLSGTLDLESYHFSGEAPGLLFTDRKDLFQPRLTLFCDGQLGTGVYGFAQARVDRGFDPGDASLEMRLEEYALRCTPWEDGRLNFQVGRFATVVGKAVERHLSWENPFVTAPLIYEHVTRVSDEEAPADLVSFLQDPGDEKYEYNPVLWGPSYATGMSVSGRLGRFDYAVEMKNAALSSRPEAWDYGRRGFDDPTFSTRLGMRPAMAWNAGISASRGPYLLESAEPGLPAGSGIADFHQTVFGQDISYSWGHWQLWFEMYQARFEVPNIGNADTLGYFLESKYKFTPSVFGAIRWNQQYFGKVDGAAGGRTAWGEDLSRLDTALIYRFSPYGQIKAQYSLQWEHQGESEPDHLFATQFTLRF